MYVWAQDEAEQRMEPQAGQLPQPLPPCRPQPQWGCGQACWLSCRACEAGAVATGSAFVCTWPSPSP